MTEKPIDFFREQSNVSVIDLGTDRGELRCFEIAYSSGYDARSEHVVIDTAVEDVLVVKLELIDSLFKKNSFVQDSHFSFRDKSGPASSSRRGRDSGTPRIGESRSAACAK